MLQTMLSQLRNNKLSQACTRGWRHYCNFLDTYTWRAQALNTGVLMGTGDCIAQLVIERKTFKQYDGVRTLRFLGAGMCVLGPSMYVWYTNLDRIVKGTVTLKIAVQKMLMDQTMFFPIYLATYISTLAVFRGESLEGVKGKLKRDYKSSLIVSYQIWPCVMLGNFYFIPLRHRIFVMNLVGLIWSTIVGWKAEHKGHANNEDEQELPTEAKDIKIKKKVAYCED